MKVLCEAVVLISSYVEAQVEVFQVPLSSRHEKRKIALGVQMRK